MTPNELVHLQFILNICLSPSVGIITYILLNLGPIVFLLVNERNFFNRSFFGAFFIFLCLIFAPIVNMVLLSFILKTYKLSTIPHLLPVYIYLSRTLISGFALSFARRDDNIFTEIITNIFNLDIKMRKLWTL